MASNDIEKDFETPIYNYRESDFLYAAKGSHNFDGESSFDVLLHSRWKSAMAAGHFNYRVDTVETKILPGKYRILSQLNTNRSKKRRKPEEISSVYQQFDDKKFNFTKIEAHEVLLQVIHRTCSQESQCGESHDHGNLHFGSVVINTAPICYSHSLLVPNPSQHKPQVVDHEGLNLAVHVALLAHSPDFRIAFNSLAGFASVNHLHFHMYYLPYHLYIESAKCMKLAGPCYVFEDYHSPGFVFELEEQNVNKLVSSVMAVVNILLEEQIAHNIFITRGTPLFSPSSGDNTFRSLRLILWARKPSYGVKDVSVFAAAVCELAGHVPVYCDERWNSLCQEDIVPILNNTCLEPFTAMLPKVKELFS